MPRTQEDNLRIKEERRKSILKSSLVIFAQYGLTAAKMSDIAKDAGISYGLVYKYFPSKEDIFIQLINDYMAEGQDIVQDIKRKDLSSLQSIQEIFIRLFNENDGDSTAGMYIRLILQLQFHPKLWNRLTIGEYSDDPIFQYLLDLIRDGQERGEIIAINPTTIGMILGFISYGLNMNGEEVHNSGMKSDEITALITRMLKV